MVSGESVMLVCFVVPRPDAKSARRQRAAERHATHCRARCILNLVWSAVRSI